MIAPLSLSHIAKSCPELNAQLLGGDCAFTRLTTDSRQLQAGEVFLALRGDRFDGHDFLASAAHQGAIALVTEQSDRDLDLPQLVVNDSLKALGQIAALNRAAFKGPLVALTGSSGKTTVKTMIAQILKECGETLATRGNLNNHIGVPLTLLQLEAKHEYAVIEMGASGPGEIAYLCSLAKPQVVLVNNVMTAHLKGFGSLEGVARAKGEIYECLPENGTAVVNLDEPFAAQWLARLTNKNVLAVSLDNPSRAQVSARNAQFFADRVTFDLQILGETWPVTLQVPGEHSLRNALAAAACAWAAGARGEQIVRGLSSFTAVAGRMNRQRGLGGALIIDDSYNANPGSVRAAIDVLVAQGPGAALVLGDMGELGEDAEVLHAELGRYARQKGLPRLYTLGQLTRHTSEAFGESARHFTNAEELIEQLKNEAAADRCFLIKGSRSARMELVVRALCDANTNGDTH
jgi:UDP-N-acetylmuramoyl-tripeptide--D-alanyl-D-alanine ligase